MNLVKRQENSMAGIAASREIQIAQGQMLMARNYPRNIEAATARIMDACKREKFAHAARYAFPRGKDSNGKPNIVTGLSSEASRLIKLQWTNMESGWFEVERIPAAGGMPSSSIIVCYAMDLETNSRQSVTVHVRHWRDTKGGGYALTDERDIYELNANMAARRERKCVLDLIPSYVREDMEEAVARTIAASEPAKLADRRKVAVAYFQKAFKVGLKAIEDFLGNKIDVATADQLDRLNLIANSLKDGEASAIDFFNLALDGADAEPQEPAAAAPTSASNRKATVRNFATSKKKTESQPPAKSQPEASPRPSREEIEAEMKDCFIALKWSEDQALEFLRSKAGGRDPADLNDGELWDMLTVTKAEAAKKAGK